MLQTIDADVAVIMPHYNCAEFLPQAVQSILLQRDVRLKLIFVDDCSPTSEWRTALAPFLGDERLAVLQTGRNVGPWRVDNWLFERLRTPYLAFQDADDFSDPERLRALLDELEASRADIVGSDYYEISETGEILRLRTMPRDVNRALARGRDHAILHGAVLMRRSVLERLGGLDGTDPYLGADTDFALRASFVARMRNLARPLYFYRRRANSLTQSKETGFDSVARKAYKERMLREHRRRRSAALWGLLLPRRWRRPPSLANRPNDVEVEIFPVAG